MGSQTPTVAYALLVLARTRSAAKAKNVGLARWLPLRSPLTVGLACQPSARRTGEHDLMVAGWTLALAITASLAPAIRAAEAADVAAVDRREPAT
jgi:hypothetical protein